MSIWKTGRKNIIFRPKKYKRRMDLKFKELREYISRFDKVAVCLHETMCYETYDFISEVSEKYDDMYVIGFGMSELEFEITDFSLPYEVEEKRIDETRYFAKCIEINFSEKTREEVFEELAEIKWQK